MVIPKDLWGSVTMILWLLTGVSFPGVNCNTGGLGKGDVQKFRSVDRRVSKGIVS